jgi:hypothetical protein
VPAAVSLAKFVAAVQFADPSAGVQIDTSTGEIVEGALPVTDGDQSTSVGPPGRFRTIAIEVDELDLAGRFCETVADPIHRKRLETALASARPIESFESALYRVGIAHRWFPFYNQQIGQLAKAWLEAQAIPFVDDLA